jgi:lysozyme family protein
VLGPRTIQAINSMPTLRLVARFNGARLAFMAGLSVWPTFGRGWALRIADNLMEA